MHMKTLPLAFIILAFSCVSQQKYDELQEKVNHLESQNSELIKTLHEFTDNKTPYATPSYQNREEVKIAIPSTYAFVLLEVEEVTGFTTANGFLENKTQRFNYTSLVKEFKPFNEEVKYQFLDEIVGEYKLNRGGVPTSGKILKRECFVFNSYEEASKEREKYVLQ